MARRILRTKLCDILGIEYPILSAGMGPSLVGEKTGAPVELVAAVSEAGGLGVLGAAGFTVEELAGQIREQQGQLELAREHYELAVRHGERRTSEVVDDARARLEALDELGVH